MDNEEKMLKKMRNLMLDRLYMAWIMRNLPPMFVRGDLKEKDRIKPGKGTLIK